MSILRRLNNFYGRLKQEQDYKKLQKDHAEHASDVEYDWNWKDVNFNRIALINYLLPKVGGYDAQYLEIGCNDNMLFDCVPCANKIGVDPTAGGTHRMTSDDFFAQNDRKFDFIFVDGLHHYEQIHRDAANAMRSLKPGGWIAFHDLLPRNWREHHVPRIQDAWTGDGWKVAYELSKTEGVDLRIFHIDHGVGAMRLTDPDAVPVDLSGELAEAPFSYFVDIKDDLPIVKWDEGIAWIDREAAG